MNSIYLERLKRLTIMDDDFGRMVFKDLKCSKELLKILHLVDDDTIIIHHETQNDVKNPNQRSIIFDILVLTSEASYDIELENKKSRANGLRARFHASSMDIHVSTTNQDFKDLLENIVIFVCSFDPFGYGLPIYTIERKVTELDIRFQDKSKIIYINGNYKGKDEIGRLIHDLKCNDPNQMHNTILKERVRYFKEDKGGYFEMCQVWEEIRAEGKEEGLAEGIYSSLIAIIDNLKVSLEEAMRILSVSEEDYPKYQAMYEKQVLK